MQPCHGNGMLHETIFNAPCTIRRNSGNNVADRFQKRTQRDVALKSPSATCYTTLIFLRNNVSLKMGLCKKQRDEVLELPEHESWREGQKENTFCGINRNKVTNESRKPVQYQITTTTNNKQTPSLLYSS